jgi:hypothetical protein
MRGNGSGLIHRAVGQGEIHDDDVGTELLVGAVGLRGIACFAAHRKAGVALDEPPVPRGQPDDRRRTRPGWEARLRSHRANVARDAGQSLIAASEV